MIHVRYKDDEGVFWIPIDPEERIEVKGSTVEGPDEYGDYIVTIEIRWVD